MATDSLRDHISSFRPPSKSSPPNLGSKTMLKIELWKGQPQGCTCETKRSPKPSPTSQADCEEVANPPPTFQLIIVSMSMNGLHNKNANGGSSVGMEIGDEHK